MRGVTDHPRLQVFVVMLQPLQRAILLQNKCMFLTAQTLPIYNPNTDTWSNGVQMQTSRFNLGVAVVNDLLYTIGGHTYSFIPGNYEPLDVNQQYITIGYVPEFPAQAILPLLLTTIAVIIFCRQKLSKNSRQC